MRLRHIPQKTSLENTGPVDCQHFSLLDSRLLLPHLLAPFHNYSDIPRRYLMSNAAAIQVVLSVKLIKQKGKFVLESILLGELIILALKSDEFLEITWKQSLIALIPFFVFLGSAFFFILIYTILLKLYYFETYSMKKLSLLFLILNLACFTLMLSIPLSRLFLDVDPIILCILAMAAASSNSIFLWVSSQEIALHFCVHKYEVFENDKESKIELIAVKASKRNLYRLSENWFGSEVKDSKVPMLSSKYP